MNLKKIIEDSFDSAVQWSVNRNIVSNAIKSSAFVSNLGENLYKSLNDSILTLNVINVTNEGEKKSGEWLLDITITEDTDDGFKKKIKWAIESESNSSLKSFNDDFAKLYHIASDYYLYLNGLNHKTVVGRDNYIKKRLKTAANILGNSNRNFWLGFWASPCKSGNVDSIWSEVLDGKQFSHLRDIHLFRLENGEFIEARNEASI